MLSIIPHCRLPFVSLHYVQSEGIQFGFDAAHTSFNRYEHVLTSSNVQNLVQGWTAETGGSITSELVVANGVVYVGSQSGKLYVFKASGCNQSPCQPLWTARTDPGDGIWSTPAVANGVVYVGSANGILYAFNASECIKSPCQPLWTAKTINSIEVAPTVANKVVYINTSATLYAFKASGCNQSPCQPLWTAEPGGDAASSPAVANGVVYTSSQEGELSAFKASGCNQPPCQPLWTAQTDIHLSVLSTLAVANGVVYVGSGGGTVGTKGKLYAFKASGCNQSPCQPLWVAQAGRTIVSSLAVANGVVYVGSWDGKLYAFKTGGCNQSPCQPLWTARTGDRIGVLVVANGVVYVIGMQGTLYTFHLKQ